MHARSRCHPKRSVARYGKAANAVEPCPQKRPRMPVILQHLVPAACDNLAGGQRRQGEYAVIGITRASRKRIRQAAAAVKRSTRRAAHPEVAVRLLQDAA